MPVMISGQERGMGVASSSNKGKFGRDDVDFGALQKPWGLCDYLSFFPACGASVCYELEGALTVRLSVGFGTCISCTST